MPQETPKQEQSGPGNGPDLARMIDHTLLKPEATRAQVRQLCEEAGRYHFASVVVNPTHVKLAAQLLQNSDVEICVVVGFPLGATLPQVKVYETGQTLDGGATEIDMVINIGALKENNDTLVEQDIAGVVQIAHSREALVKVIIETALLTDDEKVRACQLAVKAGADFVKTSTGFSSSGATADDVALMRRTVGPDIGVKAAGGIRTLADAQKMIAAGATRLGASAGVKIVQEANSL
jgi:deoxyribose-phosphate aldolase